MRQKSAETYVKVLALIADGLRNKDIAARLKISSAYVSQIKRFFGLIGACGHEEAKRLFEIATVARLCGLPTEHIAKKSKPKKPRNVNEKCRYYVANKRSECGSPTGIGKKLLR